MTARRERWLVLAGLSSLAVTVCLLRLLIDRDPSGSLGLAWPDPAYARFRWTPMANGIIAGVSRYRS